MKIKKYLQQSPIFALNAAYETIVPKLNKKMKVDQLNLLQGLVLTALFFEERNDVTPSQLAEIFQTSRGNMSHIISDLEYQGYIKRVVNDKDARQFKIELRADGRKKALASIRFYDRLQELFEKNLGVTNCQRTVEGIHSLADVFKKFI
ncbi:MAG: MarR family winged helix-turn-helix transcriptional regulator [Bdellovibrionota bacterium]